MIYCFPRCKLLRKTRFLEKMVKKDATSFQCNISYSLRLSPHSSTLFTSISVFRSLIIYFYVFPQNKKCTVIVDIKISNYNFIIKKKSILTWQNILHSRYKKIGIQQLNNKKVIYTLLVHLYLYISHCQKKHPSVCLFIEQLS